MGLITLHIRPSHQYLFLVTSEGSGQVAHIPNSFVIRSEAERIY